MTSLVAASSLGLADLGMAGGAKLGLAGGAKLGLAGGAKLGLAGGAELALSTRNVKAPGGERLGAARLRRERAGSESSIASYPGGSTASCLGARPAACLGGQGRSKMTRPGIRPIPAEIEYNNMRFLITEQPQDVTMDTYIKLLQEHRVSHLVCATDQAYHTEDLCKSGVAVSELSFPDGSAPTQEIIERWLSLVNQEFKVDPGTCVGVHCVTGLGRAPVLVATALIELGMKYEDAVDLIRKKRRGAINAKQLEFLSKYKRRKYFIKGKNNCRIQ